MTNTQATDLALETIKRNRKYAEVATVSPAEFTCLQSNNPSLADDDALVALKSTSKYDALLATVGLVKECIWMMGGYYLVRVTSAN